jgi:pimeloyl-ACP methyl ester carboxylesterase
VAWVAEALAAEAAAEPADVDPTEIFSSHPGYVHALLHDPLTWHGGFRHETLRAVAATWPEVRAGLDAGLPELPVLFVHGEADPVVPLAHGRANAAQLPGASIVTFPGDLHDVLNECDRAQVHDAVASFLTTAVDVAAPAA